MSAGISLSTVASVVGIASGVNSLLGDSGGGSTSGASYQGGLQAGMSPWWLNRDYGTAAAGQLNKLITGGPTTIADDPAYQAYLKQGMQGAMRGGAKAGMLYSGNEQSALNELSKSSMFDYWNAMVGNLSNLSGVQYSPSSGVSAGTSAGQLGLSGSKWASQVQGQGLGGIMQGLSGLSKGWGSTSSGAVDTSSWDMSGGVTPYNGPAPTDLAGTGYI